MKKFYLLLFMGILSMFVFSACEKDSTNPQNLSFKSFRLEVAPMSSDSKVFFNMDSLGLYYNQGDVLYVNGNPFTIRKHNDGKWYAEGEADVPGEGDDGNIFNFLCVDGPAVVEYSSPSYSVVLPHSFTSENNFGSVSGIVLTGQSTTNVVTLKSCFAVLLFEDTYNNYDQINVGFETSKYPLDFTVDASTHSLGSVTYKMSAPYNGGGLDNTLRMKDTTIGNKHYFYLGVPVSGSVSTYLYLAYKKGNTTIQRKTASQIQMVPNKVYKLPNDTLSNAFDENGRGIGLFQVNNQGATVRFSAGNLQCIPNVNGQSYKFADHQYDYLGLGDNQAVSLNYEGWIDLFGWGTGGLRAGLDTTLNTYYGNGENDIDGSNRDWGVYCTNIVKYGAKTSTATWRTLTSAEWYYLINNRQGKHGFATITTGTSTSYYGLVLLPEVWSNPSECENFNAGGFNTYTLYQWDKMEKAGAIFLPAAGFRSGKPVSVSNRNDYGFYWSTTHNSTNQAKALRFMNMGTYYTVSVANRNRSYGQSVRLVCDNN